MNAVRAGLEDQLAQVRQDLTEIDEQVAGGEVDAATAQRLRATYESEADRLQGQLEAVEADSEPGTGRSRTRMLAGALVLGIGAMVIVAAAILSLGDRAPGGNLTGGIASDVIAGEGVDLEDVTTDEMEAVVAANPEVVRMRLALARRYFEAGDFDLALDHYMVILEDQGVSDPEALANVGWMTALSGRPDVARTFVDRALDIQPDFPQAYWFLGNIAMLLDDRGGARSAFEKLLSYEVLPDDIRDAAEASLRDLEAG